MCHGHPRLQALAWELEGQGWCGQGSYSKPRVVQLMLSLIRDKSAELWAPFCLWERKSNGSKDLEEKENQHKFVAAHELLTGLDRTTGLCQGLMVFFTTDLHSWNFPAWSPSWRLSLRSTSHQESTAKYPQLHEKVRDKKTCRDYMLWTGDKISNSQKQQNLEWAERTRCTWSLLSSVWITYWSARKCSLREHNEGHRRWKLHLGPRQWDSPSPAQLKAALVSKLVSPAKRYLFSVLVPEIATLWS